MDSAAMGFVYLLVLVILYFLPWLIAMLNRHRQIAGIFFLNLFLGWTLVGWVVALVWAVQSGAAKPVRPTIDPTRKCPHCAEVIKAEARVCRFCGRDVDPIAPAGPAPVTY